MLRTHYFQCPDCNGVFGFTQHLTSEPLPNFCPLCGSNMTEPPQSVFVPAAPHIGKTIGKTGDQVYRQMEAASVENAQLAHSIGGGDIADYAHTKITNMADSLRMGDIAAKTVNNPVSRMMQSMGQGGFRPMGGMSGADYAATTSTGAFPRQGETARRDLVATHGDRARAIEAMGRISRSR